ncbi:hypothetical protein, partial [Bifidobacterium merycicum]
VDFEMIGSRWILVFVGRGRESDKWVKDRENREKTGREQGKRGHRTERDERGHRQGGNRKREEEKPEKRKSPHAVH